jgi:hypothetical protein
VALAGGWLFALDPFSKRYASIILSETLATLLFVIAFYALVRVSEADARRRWSIAAGATIGALTLVRPSMSLLLLFAAAGLLAFTRGPLRRRLAVSGAMVLCAVVVLAPWLVRNSALVGRPVLGGWGDGIGLLIAAYGEGPARSVGDVARDPGMMRDLRRAQSLLPAAAQVRRSPDLYPRQLVRADARLRHRAVSLYGTRLGGEPLTVLGEYAYRAYAFWMPYNDPDQYRPAKLMPVLKALDLAALALACIGSVVAVRRRGIAAAVVAFLVLFMLVSAVIHVESRYSQPLRPLLLTLAGAGLLALAAAAGRRGPKPATA